MYTKKKQANKPVQITTENYIKIALKTESPVDKQMVGRAKKCMRLLHGVIGLNTESVELRDGLLQGRMSNVVEELGDLCWYLSLCLDYLDYDWKNVDPVDADTDTDFNTMAAAAEHLIQNSSILLDKCKKMVFYGKKFENYDLLEELQCIADAIYYIAQALEKPLSIEEVMELNVQKLQGVRYKKSEYSHAAAQNRNLEDEDSVFQNLDEKDEDIDDEEDSTPSEILSDCTKVEREPTQALVQVALMHGWIFKKFGKVEGQETFYLIHPEDASQHWAANWMDLYNDGSHLVPHWLERRMRELGYKFSIQTKANQTKANQTKANQPEAVSSESLDGRTRDSNYDRDCTICRRPIHKTNKGTICTDCFVKYKKQFQPDTNEIAEAAANCAAPPQE